jgi:hypothetical protein
VREQEELRKAYVYGAPARLYPNVPNPPIPMPVPLDKYTGTYHEAGYGNLSISQTCASESPAANCTLQARVHNLNKFIPLHANLTHVSGDYWLARAIMESHNLHEPDVVLRAEFQVDAAGVVSKFGADLRLETEQTPLIWFDRVN